MRRIVHRSILFLLALNFLVACNGAGNAADSGSRKPVVSPAVSTANPTIATTEVIPPPPAEPPQDAGSLPDGATVQKLMQTAHLHWQTVWGDTLGMNYPGDGSTTPHSGSRMQAWVQQPTLARALIGPLEGKPEQMWVSNGSKFRDINGDLQPFPEYVTQPQPAPAGAPDSVPAQPPGLLLGIPLSDLLFPVGLASRPGTYRTVGRESIAGRKAYVLEWSPPDGPVIDRFWVDTATGIILRWQNFRKPDGAAITGDSYFTSILIDVVIPESAFSLEAQLPADFAGSYTDIP